MHLAPILALAAALAPNQGPAAPELVLVNGRIATLDASQPRVSALASRGGRIVALGDDDAVRALAGPDTRVLDLEGAFAAPGLIESHGHFLAIGDSLLQLDLTSAASWDAIVAQVAAAVARAKPGEPIRGRGWHQEKWTRRPEPSVEGFPTHASLSAVSPDNPVVLVHASGHASFANAKAMELAGITRDTPDPPGGEIVRDAHGDAIGVFNESAEGLLDKALEDAPQPDRRRRAELAMQEVLSKGITSFQDAGSSFEDVDFFRSLADVGGLRCRLYVMLHEPNARLAGRLAGARLVGYADEHLTVRAIKRWIDGALGSRGAWLLEPYADLPSSTGQNTCPPAELDATAQLALANGFQLCVHAIGDRGNREALDAFERAFAGREGATDLRWRIEHAQHLSPEDVPRFAELGVIASMQGVHCTSDGPWVIPRLGLERAREGAYVWRKLIDAGAVICNGTDAPVEDVDPLACFAASVTRRLADGTRFFPEQCMTREEALASYTRNAAYAAFEEQEKGTLALGKLADVTVLSVDLLTCSEDELSKARVLYTIVGGKVEYSAR